MEFQKKNSGDTVSQIRKHHEEPPSWLGIIIMLSIFWPVGVFLLFKRLSMQYANRYQNEPHHTYAHSEPINAYTDQAKKTTQKKSTDTSENSSDKKQKKTIRILTIIGAVLFGLFGLHSAILIGDWLSYGYLWLDELLPSLFMGCGMGGGMLFAASKLKKRMLLVKRYMSIIGKRKTMSIDELASIESTAYKKVCKNIEALIEDGLLPNAYIDHSRRLLVLSTDGLENDPLYSKASKPKVKEEEKPDENALDEKELYLRRIKKVNDEIDDPELSEKIDRIGMLTAKMFEAVEKSPEKRPQIETFLNYYLPTTLKILNAYRDFEDHTARGENITSAMQDIENIMDTLVSGFEKQLDLLFENDALDISTDINVLESMLAKDGLSDTGELKLR